MADSATIVRCYDRTMTNQGNVYKVEAYMKNRHQFCIVETFLTGFPERDIQDDRLRRIQKGLPRADYAVSLAR